MSLLPTVLNSHHPQKIPRIMIDEEFYFESSVERLNDWLQMHAVRIPDEIALKMKELDCRRFVGTMNSIRINRAIQFRKEVGFVISVGSDVLKKGNLHEGSLVRVSLRPDPNPDVIDVIDEFAQVLEQDEEAAQKWEELTPGRQRGLAHYLGTAKQTETKIKRSLEVAHKLKTDGFYKS